MTALAVLLRAVRRARALSAERQTLLRQQFIDALSHAMQVDSATSTRADVIFAIGQRARSS